MLAGLGMLLMMIIGLIWTAIPVGTLVFVILGYRKLCNIEKILSKKNEDL